MGVTIWRTHLGVTADRAARYRMRHLVTFFTAASARSISSVSSRNKGSSEQRQTALAARLEEAVAIGHFVDGLD